MGSAPDAELDVCGVCCPLPLIQLAKMVAGLTPGQTVEITGNDPIFESSVRDFCQANGHAVIGVKTEEARRVSLRLRIGGES
jgi:TusA-related sulfurtransferase